MRISRQTFEDGVAREREKHHITWEWISWYFTKHKKLPKEEEFYLHLVDDNLKIDENHYSKS
jgi:hypothetical protein